MKSDSLLKKIEEVEDIESLYSKGIYKDKYVRKYPKYVHCNMCASKSLWKAHIDKYCCSSCVHCQKDGIEFEKWFKTHFEKYGNLPAKAYA